MLTCTLSLLLCINLHLSYGQQSSCQLVSEGARIDCHPSPNATESVCLQRNCCWNLTKNENVPKCFYSPNHDGYIIRTLKTIVGGTRYFLERKVNPYPPNEFMHILADVTYVSPSIIRLRITSRTLDRFEVPYVFEMEPIDEPVTSDFEVKVKSNPFSVIIWSKLTREKIFDSTIGPLLFADQFLQISSYLPNNYVYGLGEHRNRLKIDCGWRTLPFWNRDQPPVVDHNLYGTHPMLIVPGDQGYYGMFLLNSNAMEVVLQPAPAITFRTIGGVIDLFVYAGPTPQDVIRQHWSVVQFPYFQPYWAMGFHLCRYGYHDITDLRNVMKRMNDTGFQYDVQWTDIDAMQDKLVFTYDKKNWAGLPDLVRKLHESNMYYTPINDPCIGKSPPPGTYPALDNGLKLDVFIKNNDGSLLVGRVWPGDCYFPDFTNPSAVSWWSSEIKKFNQTVPFDGFWIDMNEPASFVPGSVKGCTKNELDEPWYVPKIIGGTLYDKTVCPSAKQVMSTQYNLHSLYGFLETRVTLKAIDALTPNRRNFILSRSTFAGSGHYAGHWSGDNWSSWDDLHYSISEILNFQFYGMPFVGADICGFFDNTTEQLCMRWMQLGAFYPFMRNHNTIGVNPQDPAVFSQSAREVMHKALLIRYRLMPYWYTLHFQASTDGKVVLNPMFFVCPKDPVCQGLDTQFLLGEALLVAPVLTENATKLQVYFPDQNGDPYYDYYTSKPLSVVGWAETGVLLDTLGLYWRAGHVVPMHLIDETKNVMQNRNSSFCLIVTLSRNKISTGGLYWDDGFSALVDDEGLGVLSTKLMFAAGDGYVTINSYQALYEGVLLLDEIKVLGIQPVKVSKVSVDGRSHSSFIQDDTLLVIKSLAMNMNTLKTIVANWTYQ